MFFLANKYPSLSYFKINKLRKKLSFLRYLLMSFFIFAFFHSSPNFLKKYLQLYFSLPLIQIITSLFNCYHKSPFNLLNLKAFSILDLCSIDVFALIFVYLGESILGGKSQTSSPGSRHLEPFWSLAIFSPHSSERLFYSYPPTHTCVAQGLAERCLFSILVLVSFQLLRYFQSSCLD